MVTKIDENVVVVKSAAELESLDRSVFQFTARKVFRSWKEDFCDEETGEVITVDRTEPVFDKGQCLTPDDFSKLLFHLQCGDIQEIAFSNVQRSATLVSNRGFGIWLVKAEGARFKPKMMLRATNAMSAYEVAKDYIELNYTGDFFIKSVKACDESIIIEPKDDDESKEVFKNWYSVDVLLDDERDPENIETVGPYYFIVYAETVEAAKVIIENRIAHKRAEQEETDKYSLKLTKATTIGANVVVPMEFCMAYRKGGGE